MKNYLLILPVVAISGLLLSGCLGQKTATPIIEPTPTTEVSQPTPATNQTETASPGAAVNGNGGENVTYTLEDIAVHNTKSDCWTVISGDVYDLSPFLASGKHPGGDKAVAACGIDGTTFFETRPMGSGTPHSSQARKLMVNFLIGTLAK